VAGSYYYRIADPDCKVEFRGVFASTIPLLIKPLEDENSDVRREAVQLIDKLANHGEWQLTVLQHS
jgi:hypothetical protein